MFRKTLWSLIVVLSLQLTPAGSFPPTAQGFEPLPLRPTHAALVKTPTLSKQRRRATPLWPGSRFTQLDRARALSRGLRFIYRTALDRRNFADYGSDYLWCFYTLSTAVRDESLKRTARRMGVERALHWRRLHRALPPNANAATIIDYVFGSDAADSLNVRDERLKEQIRRAASRHKTLDYLLFDPLVEPPPVDVPDECKYDRAANPRGSRVCRVCKRPLKMRSRYDVWYDALITAYSGDRYGVKLGAHYADVLKWLPALRPYRGSENGANPDFYDTVYAITHIVYTLNNYGQYRLSHTLLPQEYQFLKSNLREAIASDDADMLGEFMDSLRAFGLTSEDPDMRAGMEYYLSRQNRDGSWGKMNEADIYDRYHPTWNAIAGLSEYDWRAGERLSFPEIRPLLERLNLEHAAMLPTAKALENQSGGSFLF
ncbi:MAG TPA: hypothetical protein VM911_17130 [Pyrinomonadaceae bacterium]|nr:hypothetical protein [Pyrinomonadaceae bacterium]